VAWTRAEDTVATDDNAPELARGCVGVDHAAAPSAAATQPRRSGNLARDRSPGILGWDVPGPHPSNHSLG